MSDNGNLLDVTQFANLKAQIGGVVKVAKKHQRRLIAINKAQGKLNREKARIFFWFQYTESYGKIGLGFETWDQFANSCGYTRQSASRFARIGREESVLDPLFDRVGQDVLDQIVKTKKAMTDNSRLPDGYASDQIKAIVAKAVSEKMSPTLIKESLVEAKLAADSYGLTLLQRIEAELTAAIDDLKKARDKVSELEERVETLKMQRKQVEDKAD